MSKLTQLTSQEISGLPLDQVGLLALDHMIVEPSGTWHVYNFLGLLKAFDRQALYAVSEGINWCMQMGLIGHFMPDQGNEGSIYVTRLGRQVHEGGIGVAMAAQRLSVDLHARLEPVRTQFLLGEYELAAFRAMREVEIRVRELGAFDDSRIGVHLMREAFAVKAGALGPLSDGALDPGEREGIQHLFAGAIATFKNPPSHRQVNYDDPTEASEVVLFADLLMRLLDRIAQKKGLDG
jgi:uncharacterized protein (TIGR02391 family)